MLIYAFGKGHLDVVSYYATLALSICRNLRAYNSDVFTRYA